MTRACELPRGEAVASARPRQREPQSLHLITGEYPPQPGGVSDFSAQVSTGLAAAGGDVHVWAPGRDEPESLGERLTVHREAGSWTPADLRRVGQRLDALPGPRRLLVQWVPHAFGWRSLNLPLCAWLRARARRGDRLDIVIHEPFVALHEGSWRQDAAAVIHRAMIALLLASARRVWVTTTAWTDLVRPFVAADTPVEWLPVPSSVPVASDAPTVDALRRALGTTVVGHFGTYGSAIASLLLNTLAGVASARPDARFLLMGRGSTEFAARAEAARSELQGRIHASGGLPPHALSSHLQACTVMLQPYPDGITTRRTSAMAALAHGLPVVTTTGRLSEGLWEGCGAVALAPAGDAGALHRAVDGLLEDEGARRRLASRAAELYRQRFDLSHTLAALGKGQ